MTWDDDLYVVKQLQHSSTILDEFTVYSSNKFKAAFEASAWAITVWQQSTAKSVKQRLAGNPYRERVAANEFNPLAGAMPLLDLPDRQLTEAVELALKHILDHILNSLVSGSQHDYDIFVDWCAYVAQNPDRKIAYMPFLRGPAKESSSPSCYCHCLARASNYPPEQIMKLNAKMRQYIFFRTKMLPYSAEK
ncbi:TPA: hypothetical protein ACH3X1_005202 [Trebouxia sp. C0004]